MDTQQYMSMFLEESMDNLQTLNESLLELEQNPDDKNKLNEIFRVAHTIKGMAATMGFSQMAELTHKMEDVLTEFREGVLSVNQNVVTVLFQCLDTLEGMVNTIQDEGSLNNVDIEKIMQSLQSISESKNDEPIESKEIEKEAAPVKAAVEPGAKPTIALNEYDVNVIRQAGYRGYNAYEIKVILNKNTLLKSARAFLVFKTLEDNGEIIKSIPNTEDIENENFDFEIDLVYVSEKNKEFVYNNIKGISEIDEVIISVLDLGKPSSAPAKENAEVKTEAKKAEAPKPKADAKKQPEKEASPQHKKAHQSVRVDLERLDKFMNMVSELVINRTRLEKISSNYKLAELNETLEQVARTTSDLQDLVMKIRMLPVDIVFNRFPRLIRDLSVELNKEINFVMQGADTELDRTVIDEIGEPLIHLLRNAADHGVESKEDREKSGKNPVGTIKLSAYQEGTKAVIKVEDDGAGINLEKVKAKAEKVGISTEGMSDNDIKNLIFAQGFSTSEQVTDISGRGVGMDVVKTKVSSLGGTLDLVSEEGKGSAFIIKLPLTLQIIQSLLVNIGTETFAISLAYIDRVIDFKEEMVKKTNNKEVIVYRDSVIPFVRVNEKLKIDSGDNKNKYVVIAKVGDKTTGLLVDSLLGQQEIVIKPLGKTLSKVKEYIGATILGDGLVTLILDAAAMI
ncbi:chemotaxis protein CheA [Clostridium sp. 19966]|uniref:chemotaxis protein CheA n=1 Tax=Clostridium sp. 19966 TaxID=2768166 RepID=UPI0028DF74C8|nr:chemotaxis protein CheA [Clostridium sp. 19966]MDT8716681.1 chemotaxis protein CheA [Clostridium sp. 19966]